MSESPDPRRMRRLPGRRVPPNVYRRRRIVLGVGIVVVMMVCWAVIRGIGVVTSDHTTTLSGWVPQRVSGGLTVMPDLPTSTDSEGLVHLEVEPTGEYDQNTITQNSQRDGRAIPYLVKVETVLGLDADSVAATIHAALDDDRGWAPIEGVAFHLVGDEQAAQLVITVATAQATDEACLPMTTEGKWSCRNGDHVNLNGDRWLYGTPRYADVALDDYRSYLVNHEVGHYLGRGHEYCPGEGQPAPVMQQQSVDLQGCTINVWPG